MIQTPPSCGSAVSPVPQELCGEGGLPALPLNPTAEVFRTCHHLLRSPCGISLATLGTQSDLGPALSGIIIFLLITVNNDVTAS